MYLSMLTLLQNFRSMCSAAVKSNYNSNSQENIQVTTDTRNYQNWWFLFANFLFREITHVFLDTYLPNGLDITLTSSTFNLLEELVLGGILSCSHDSIVKKCDVSIDTVVLARDQPLGIQADTEHRRTCLF